MKLKRILILLLALILPAAVTAWTAELNTLEGLGRHLFFDERLSSPPGQSCAACHAPEAGWTGPKSDLNRGGAVYPGAIPSRFGNRKPPSAAYANFSPVFHFRKGEKIFVGGNFWDGRATGEEIGNPAADQAKAPFVNPLEHNLKNARELCELAVSAPYSSLFQQAFPSVPQPLDCRGDLSGTVDRIALAIGAFEASAELNPFTSKYDFYLRGQARLTPAEAKGLELFNGKGKCAQCHPSDAGPYSRYPLFTDFTYDNLGTPKNPQNPFYTQQRRFNPEGKKFIDTGLGGFLRTRPEYRSQTGANLGKHKVPTLRNVDLRPAPDFVKAYTHNGHFKDLKELVHFYNTRDTLPRCRGAMKAGRDCWPAPEVARNLNRDEMGNLGLTDEEEEAIVAFMQTLSDGYKID